MDRLQLSKIAADYLNKGFNCCESMLGAFLPLLGQGQELLRIGTPFGAGIGARRDLCGILTGAIIIIGLKCGRLDCKDTETKSRAYHLAGQFHRWFKANFGLKCSDILPGEFKGHTERCIDIIREAAGFLHQLLPP